MSTHYVDTETIKFKSRSIQEVGKIFMFNSFVLRIKNIYISDNETLVN